MTSDNNKKKWNKWNKKYATLSFFIFVNYVVDKFEQVLRKQNKTQQKYLLIWYILIIINDVMIIQSNIFRNNNLGKKNNFEFWWRTKIER